MIHYSIRKVDTVMGLLHLVGLVKQRAVFGEKVRKTMPPQSCNNLGECLPNFRPPYTTEFAYFIMLTCKEAYAY